MRQLTVMGVSLKDFSVRESMRRVTHYLNNAQCNTIDFVTHDVLLMAASSEELTDRIEEMDMAPCTTADILQAGGIVSRGREREIESNLMLKGLFRKLAKEKRKIFLLSQTEDTMNSFAAGLKNFNRDLVVAGTCVYNETVGSDDAVVNDINTVLPDVLLLNLASPEAERFVTENRSRMNVKLVVILRDLSFKTDGEGKVKTGGIGGFLMRKFFHSAAVNYDKEVSIKNDSKV